MMWSAVNGAVLLAFAVWVVAMTLLCITESPSYADVREG